MLILKYHDAILQKNIIIIFVQPRVKYLGFSLPVT